MEKLEIRAVIKYFSKKGVPPKEIHGKPWEEFSFFIAQWAAEFKGESVEDDGQSGRPKEATADENVMVVHTLVMCDRRRDLRSIASEVGTSFGAIQ